MIFICVKIQLLAEEINSKNAVLFDHFSVQIKIETKLELSCVKLSCR